MGVAFGHGAMASLPTVTLANHTSIITGAHPGHHGILNNAWFDRATGEQVITNSQATWPWSMQHLTPGIESIHDAVHRTWPDAFTASVNEPCDIGADYSTFDFFRRGEVPPIPKDPFGLPHTTERFVRPSKDYSWSSVVDHMGVEQALGIIGGHYRDVELPDAAVHVVQLHAHRLRDARRRPALRDGRRVGARQRRPRRRDPRRRSSSAGVFDDCAFVLVADHGMEENDPTCTGDWDVALKAAAVEARDEAYGFLYLGTSDTSIAPFSIGRGLRHAQDRNRCRGRG